MNGAAQAAREKAYHNFNQNSDMNPILGMFGIGGGEIILILALVFVLFGAKKLPELAKGLGQGIKEFKKATGNLSEEMHSIMGETPPTPPKRLLPATTASTDTEGAVTQVPPGRKA
ncbi:MAG: twin-arginine translocation protein TatA/E family subunit [Pedosphaera sp.]|nr:twin-arginine translocation protein TatA/E family subunit [Pedosphaera sp.]